MANCLLTKLKEEVQNSNLLKLGELVIKINAPENDLSLNFKSAKACTLSVKNAETNSYITYAGQQTTSLSVPANSERNISVHGVCSLCISEKYSIINLYANVPSGTTAYIDANELKYSYNIASLNISFFDSPIYILAEVFGKLVNYSGRLLFPNNATGNVEDFCKSLWDEGKRDNTIGLYGYSANLKLKNTSVGGWGISAAFSSDQILVTAPKSGDTATFDGNTWSYSF